jgi:hypothetical protein
MSSNDGAVAALQESVHGPILPTWALQQVGSYLGYTGRDGNIVATAAHDPNRTSICYGSIGCSGLRSRCRG